MPFLCSKLSELGKEIERQTAYTRNGLLTARRVGREYPIEVQYEAEPVGKVESGENELRVTDRDMLSSKRERDRPGNL